MESSFIALAREKAQCQRVSQDKAAFGHMHNEEASKGFSDNPLAPLSGDFVPPLGNTFLPLTIILFPALSSENLFLINSYLKGNNHLICYSLYLNTASSAYPRVK